MKKIFTLKGVSSLLFLVIIPSLQSFSQNVSASPQNITRPVGANVVSVSLDRLQGNWGGSGSYVWTVTPTTGVTIGTYTQSGPAEGDVNVSFSSAASGTYTFTLTRGIRSASTTITAGNIAASSSSGNSISSFDVRNGVYYDGPGVIFSPGFQNAALGLSANGYYYFLPSEYAGNDGHITVYAAKPNGSDITAIGSADLNGSSNNDLGFVRLAIDQTGTGWILAGDNQTLYLGKFVTDGINQATLSVVDPNVALVNGIVSSFYNGDICVSGKGTLYALANNSNGVTQIFTGTPNATNTTLSKKWDLVDENANSFSGSVNGVAFDLLGSLYISTSTGLYYINQNTVNTATGTVQCALVKNVNGLTDLASNLFPELSTLPVSLISFTGNFRDQKATLRWETDGELNFSHFIVERSSNGGNYVVVHTRSSDIGTGKKNYQFIDDLSGTTGKVFNYRLKLVDQDGQYKYSNVIMIKTETNTINGITLNPNPVIKGMTTARFTANADGIFQFSITDLSGRVVLQQQNRVFEGNNSISLNGLDRLPAGIYVLQMQNDTELHPVKFAVGR